MAKRTKDSEIATRYVFLFLGLLLILATFLSNWWGESGISSYLIYDVGALLISIIAVILIIMNWKDQRLDSLVRQNDILLVIVVIGLVIEAIGFYVKKDTAYVGSNIQVMFGLIMAMVNRYL
ncbi:hypothetical protein M1394_00040 [Candidatus Marsarchaeota archaeon]|nr:hypothetical protein [Candidatus Marsarchaeota archaeon]